MLKSMISVLLMVILCGGLQLSCGEKLKCEFMDVSHHSVGILYTCKVTSLDNNNFNNLTINGYTGTHLANKNDKDVKAIYIHGANTKFIPEGLGTIFNLTAFLIQKSCLVEIRSKDFQGMQNLEYLDFYYNKLTYLPSDVFSTFNKLKVIYLHSNQIKYLGSGLFNGLTNLITVGLRDNFCSKDNYDGTAAITQMKDDIKANCDKPNDVIQYEIEQKITKEIRDESTKINDKNQEQFMELNEMVKQLLIESKEYQMEHHENIKLRAELSLAKDQQKKESSEAKEKMENTINDLNTEVMELKSQRQLERTTYRELRSKLKEAKDQLSECEINERSSV